jgi:diguanylate cyclase (GGDEF)-like protein
MMNIILDPGSLGLLSAITGGVTSAFLLWMRPRRGALGETFVLLALGIGMLAAGSLLSALYGATAPAPIRVLASALLGCAAIPIWQAARRSAFQPAQPVAGLLLTGIFAVLLVPLSSEHAMWQWRHLAESVWAIGFMLLAIHEWRRIDREEPALSIRAALVAATVFCALMLARLLVLLLAGDLPPGTHAGTVDQILAWLGIGFPVASLMMVVAMLGLASERSNAELERLSATGLIAGQVSRRLLFDRAQSMLTRQSRGGCLAILMIGLDEFRVVRDMYGNMTSEKILAHVARVLGAVLRDDSTMVRYGDSDFCALVPVSGEVPAFVVGERLRAAIARSPFVLGDQSLTISVNVGVSVHRHRGSLRELLGREPRPSLGEVPGSAGQLVDRNG